MYEVTLKIRRTYDDTITYSGTDILLAEALVELVKLNPKKVEVE